MNITGGWGSGCCFIWDAVDNSGGTYNGDVYVLSTNGTVTRVDGAGNPVDFTQRTKRRHRHSDRGGRA